jgi:hypothetical protein
MSLRVFIFACTMLFSTFSIHAQTPLQRSQNLSVNPYNIPADLEPCLAARPELEINGSFNPFYISGDYDGDGLTDFAVQVLDKKKQRKGVLFCFARAGKSALWDAGSPTDLWGDEPLSYDAWSLARKGGLDLSVFPHIKHDAIVLELADVGGGIVYWDGKKLRWQQGE